jgi:DNA-binding transcriptional MerR regulator
MKLKYQSKDEIPAELVDFYVEFDEDGKTIFVHKEMADTLRESYRTRGDLTQAQTKLSELGDTVKGLKQSLEDRERDDKKDQGKYKEIAEDWEKRYNADTESLKAEIGELKNASRQSVKKAAIARMAAHGTEETRSVLARVVGLDLDFNEDGELIVLEDGKATSQSLDDYEKNLAERYPSLVAEVPSNGGGAKGAKGGSPGSQKWADYSPSELSEIRRTNPAQYEKLKETR